ncbi:hypothetical protein C8R45DRAFT_782728, partial [Mycena sanguinolenta]
LDDEIALLNEQLKQLAEERFQWAGYRAKNCGILSPLRWMPPEVLGQIFGQRYPGFCETDSPWVLTHVSRMWRAVSVSTPRSWSRVIIDYPTL